MDDDFSIFSTLRYDPALRAVTERGPDHAGWNYEHESPVYLLDYHRDRLVKAATHWKWTAAIAKLEGTKGLQMLEQGLDACAGQESTSPLRMRIVVDSQGGIKFEKVECPSVPLGQLFPRRLPAPSASSGSEEPPKLDAFKLVVDNVATDESEHSHFKTTKRAFYDAARQRASIALSDQTEVLLVNRQGFAMEGSITTPYFWRGGRWVTPPVLKEIGKDADKGDGGQDGVSRRWALERYLLPLVHTAVIRIVLTS